MQFSQSCGGDEADAVTFKSVSLVFHRGICRGGGKGEFKGCGMSSHGPAGIEFRGISVDVRYLNCY